MQYVLIDDSVIYDGYSPLRRPLGGAEKAVVSLASALSDRGHDVKVINNTTYVHMAAGAYYTPFGNAAQPRSADVVIAVRKPSLLGLVRNARHRILLVPGAPDYLMSPANEPLWDSFQPTFLFVNAAQQRAYTGSVPHVVINPGVRFTFYKQPAPPPQETAPPQPEAYDPNLYGEPPPPPPPPPKPEAPPPHAVVTTHPLHGLAWLLDLWTQQIHAQMPEARLSIYSAALTKGLKGEAIPVDIIPVLEKVKAAAAANVVVSEPRPDDGMALIYQDSRVHLYPGNPQDFACWTLGESQTSGLPAVARALGGVSECMVNGETGYIVPDDAAFANVALEILRNDAVYKNLSAAACLPARQRPWESAAAELDAYVATLSTNAA